MTDDLTAAVTAEQREKHERSHAEGELYDNPGARTAKGCEPIGYLVVTWDAASGKPLLDDTYEGLYPSRAAAEEERAAWPALAPGGRPEVHRVCAVVPIEDDQHG